MENKILEAVKALGGKWESEKGKVAICKTRPELNWGHAQFFDECYFAVPITFLGESWVSVTREEFNTYAEQWLKEAYMHNAALSCNWDLDCRDAVNLVSTCDYNVVHFDVYVCTKQEFIDYCNENKPCGEVKPELDGEGVPPVGAVCTLRYMHYSKTLRHTGVVLYASRKYCILDQVGAEILCKIGDYEYEKTKSPRDKAIDEMFELDLWATDKEYVESVYDWLKQLTPEQKKEFDL